MIRTDLVGERREFQTQEVAGAEISRRKSGHVKTECIIINESRAARSLNTPCGKYFTVEFDDPLIKTDLPDIKKSVIACFDSLFDFKFESVLIIGLGNRAVTPDSLGPITCDRLISTRHLSSSQLLKELRGGFSNVSVLATGVLSATGIDAAELVLAAARQVNPSAVIVIDALAARRPQRLCRTIQLSNVGITPGSGCDGARPAINKELIGVPVISVGVPTIIDSHTYRLDCGGDDSNDELMLTPINIDRLIVRCAEFIAYSINEFFGTDALI